MSAYTSLCAVTTHASRNKSPYWLHLTTLMHHTLHMVTHTHVEMCWDWAAYTVCDYVTTCESVKFPSTLCWDDSKLAGFAAGAFNFPHLFLYHSILPGFPPLDNTILCSNCHFSIHSTNELYKFGSYGPVCCCVGVFFLQSILWTDRLCLYYTLLPFVLWLKTHYVILVRFISKTKGGIYC